MYRADRARGPVWDEKYRLPDGRQCAEEARTRMDRARAPGRFTKRQAQDVLGDLLHEARRGTLPGMTRTGATFADAAAEYLRYSQHDRGCEPFTVRDSRSTLSAHLLPAFGASPLESITPALIDAWR